MATAQKKTTGGKRTASSGSGAKKSGSGSRSKITQGSRSGGNGRKKAPQPKPVRRGVGALVCLLLAVFAVLGCVQNKGFFNDWFCGLAKGLMGYGFYLLPPMLLAAAFILAFHRGRPVALRVCCALLLPVLLGGMLHILLARGEYAWTAELIKQLWTEGQSVKGGGVLGGVLALGLSAAFSPIGAGVIFVLAMAVLAMGAANVTLADVVDFIRSRPEYEEYEEPEEPERAPRRGREAPQESAGAAVAARGKSRRAAIDIPVDEGPLVGRESAPNPLFGKKKEKFFNRRAAVPAPDEVLTGGSDVKPPEPNVPVITKPEPAHPEESVPAAGPAVPAENTAETESVSSNEPDKPPFGQYQRPGAAETAAAESAPAARENLPPMPEIQREPAVSKKARAEETAQAAAEVGRDIEKSMEEPAGPVYQYPPIDLLKRSGGVSASDMAGELQANQARLADTIRSFGIDAAIVDAVRGPSVTRYELELAQGVRMNKLTNLTDDIALALGATGVRIAPIPDKISMVGIEVPNKLVAPVGIRDVIDSREFRDNPSKVSFAVGKDISNRCVVCNIGKLPHLLIAGTTGSGKSVCTNSLIISLLYKATPEEVRLIMVDPKMVELGIYNGIPHLLIPVVTDPKKAAGALQWAVTEMMKRYRAFSEVGVRDLKAYNALAERTGEMKKMPSVVVVIDELADLMLVAAKEVEESICRVAQMGRAAGMHLIIATQRPSADVITGLMKANIPSRIAFAVQSSLDSRIILDTTGAEKLVGRGDMLYFPLGSGKPQRVQGCFISDDEVSRVVEFVKRSGTAEYDEEVLHEIEQHAAAKDKGNKGGSEPAESDAGDYDELLPNAIEVVVETGMASVSMLQRRLKLGYSRAARLVDQMEEKGVVGPFEGSKPRQVLITKAQWQEMQYRQSMSALPDDMPICDEGVPEELEFEGDAIPQSRDVPPFDLDD